MDYGGYNINRVPPDISIINKTLNRYFDKRYRKLGRTPKLKETLHYAIGKVQDASNHNLGSTGGDLGTFGAAPTSGNLLLVILWIETPTQTITLSGFTNLAQDGSSSYCRAVLYKISNGTEGTTIAVTWSNSTSSSESYIVELSGVDNTTPIDVSGSFQVEGFGGDDYNVNGITLTTNNVWDVIWINCGSNSGYSMTTGGFTTLIDKQAIGLFYKDSSSGATGTRIAHSNNFGSRSVISFGIRPSGGGPPAGNNGWGRLLNNERNRYIRN